MGKKWPVKFSRNNATSTSLSGSLTWERRLYFPSEGRHAGDFFARKIRRLRPGLNPRTWVPEGSMLTTLPPQPRTARSYYKPDCLSAITQGTEFSGTWQDVNRCFSTAVRREEDTQIKTERRSVAIHRFGQFAAWCSSGPQRLENDKKSAGTEVPLHYKNKAYIFLL
jgi:hypothetical protein